MSEQKELRDFVRCPGNDPFCLGMTEYNCRGILLKPKYSKLSLAKTKALAVSPTRQFNVTVTEEDIDKSSKGCISAGTVKSTSWAVRTFQQWIKQRSERLLQEVYPVDILQKPYATGVVCNCLQRFVSEAKRMDGTPYPRMTLYQILCGLLRRYTREFQPNPPNFLDRKDV